MFVCVSVCLVFVFLLFGLIAKHHPQTKKELNEEEIGIIQILIYIFLFLSLNFENYSFKLVLLIDEDLYVILTLLVVSAADSEDVSLPLVT